MKLPSPIQTYFEADKDPFGVAPTSAFAVDAIVKDEGNTYVGHQAIAEWFHKAKAQSEHSTNPREVSEAGGRITVLAEVSGKFPGSPALLNFMFTLKAGAIAMLEIGA